MMLDFNMPSTMTAAEVSSQEDSIASSFIKIEFCAKIRQYGQISQNLRQNNPVRIAGDFFDDFC